MNSNILVPNTELTSKMQEQREEALEAIMIITSNNIVQQHNTPKSDFNLFSDTLKNVIRDRITNILYGHPVHSRSDIIEGYLKRYPKETDGDLLELCRTKHGSVNPISSNCITETESMINIDETNKNESPSKIKPTIEMQQRIDEALDALLYLTTRKIVTEDKNINIELYSPTIRNIIRKRIENMLTAHPADSRSEIIVQYLKKYPKNRDYKIFKLLKTRLGIGCRSDLTLTDNTSSNDVTKTKNNLNANKTNNESSRIITSNILLPNAKPTSKMQKRIDEALEAILVITSNNIVQQNKTPKSHLDSLSDTMRDVIRDRITNVLTGHPVCSRSDIIDRYLNRYPKETDGELLKLCKTKHRTKNKMKTDETKHTKPTNEIQEKIDKALDAIEYLTNINIVTDDSNKDFNIELYSHVLRNIIRVRIENISSENPQASRNAVILKYFKRYPKKKNFKLIELCKKRLGTSNCVQDTHTCNTNSSNFITQTKSKTNVDKTKNGCSSNITSNNILLPNTKPTSKMQERMDEALEAILVLTSNNIVQQYKTPKSDLDSLSDTIRNVIRNRIANVLTGHPVRSRSDIIDRYLKTYPKETDIELLELCRTRPGNSLPDFAPMNNSSLSNRTTQIKIKMDVDETNENQSSPNMLLPNTEPTSELQQRMDEALDMIVSQTNHNIVSQDKSRELDVKLYTRELRNVISDRIRNVLTGQRVSSKNDIIDKYLKRFSTKTDVDIVKLYRIRQGSSIPYFIKTDNPRHFYRVNMIRLINIKMKKIITVVKNMFKNSKQQLMLLNKPVKTEANDHNVQKIYSEQYTNLLMEQELSRLLAMFKNKIVLKILKKEEKQAINMNILPKLN